MIKIDDADVTVIRALKKNARMSVQRIARETGLAKATVHRRIRKLEKSNIIRGYTAVLNREQLGKDIIAYILIRTAPAADYSVMLESVKNRDEVEDIAAIAGDFDVLIKVSVKNIKELNNFVLEYVRKLPSVTHTQTIMAFQNTTKY